MKILLAGANGYIGSKLIPVLLAKGLEVTCLVRDPSRFRNQYPFSKQVKIISADLLKPESISPIPHDIDVAYYLMQSAVLQPSFERLEAYAAHNFVEALSQTKCKQIIHLSDLINDEAIFKAQPASFYVESMLKEGSIPVTILRTSAIIGEGSLLLQIISQLIDKTSVIIAPKWIDTHCQPVAVTDVLTYLEEAALNLATYRQTFDICGPEVLTFKQMLLGYAQKYHRKCRIFAVPFLSSKLSAIWLNLLTSIGYEQAKKLLNQMKHAAICHSHTLDSIIPHHCLSYEQALTAGL